jgi:hypothetical protein
MAYRGDDAARDRAAWGAQSPRQSSGEQAGYDRPGYDGPGYDSYGQHDGYGQPDGYGQHDGYGPAGHDSGSYEAGGFGGGQAPADGYGTGNRYGTESYGTDSYSSRGYQSGAYSTGGYRAGSTGGFPAGDYGADSHDSSPHGNRPTSAYTSGGYPTTRQPSGGHPALGSGAYPALGDDSYDDGNDWYGRSGPQPTDFADTSAQLALRDPVRGYPPEPARPDDGLAYTGAYTGQQLRYDESAHVTYPGYDGVDDEHGQVARRGYDYDDYADYGTAAGDQRDQRLPGPREFDTRLDQVAVDYDAMDLGARDYAAPRGYGPALQGDDFDGGRYHDDYAGAGADVLDSVGAGARRGQAGGRGLDERSPSGPLSPPPNAPRSRGAGNNGAPKRRRRARVFWTAAGVAVLVAVAAVAGYKFMRSGQDSAAREANQPLPTSSATSAATQQCAAALGPFCHIGLRTDDPAPLTLSELYLPRFSSQKGNADFLLQTEKADTNCANALFGSQLISQVKTGKCTQILRATYLSGDQTIMGTIGVVNLTSTNQAHYAGKIIGQNDFIQPLSTSKGLTHKIGQGIGVVEASYKGHYLILTWAEFTNLKTPATAAQTQALENWQNALVAGTANIYLSQRMINGDTSATVPSGSPSASGSTSPSATSSATG